MNERAPTRSGGLGPPVVPGQGGGAAGRPSVIQLVFREKGALYAAYIPLLTDGGLFVPTTREYKLGEDIYLLLSLPDDTQRFPVAGKVAWITPPRLKSCTMMTRRPRARAATSTRSRSTFLGSA